MGRARKAKLRVRGMGLQRRFAATLVVALTLAAIGGGFLILSEVARVHAQMQRDALADAAALTQHKPRVVQRNLQAVHPSGIEIQDVLYDSEGHPATVYRAKGKTPEDDFDLFVPPERGSAGGALLGIVAGTLGMIVVVGAAVALAVAGSVTRPLALVIDDVRTIGHGELNRRIRSPGTGEVEALARSIERMLGDLQQEQYSSLGLSLREREQNLAGDVREALLPSGTPRVAGYDAGALLVPSSRIGGDFHDCIELAGGRLGLLVCDVSGNGVASALIGAAARSYLRAELMHAGAAAGAQGLADALRRANRALGADVRRGGYATALCALVDPARGRAVVASAGHKVPLLRVSAGDGNLRTVHPEGIALGLDRGAVFDKRLELAEVPLEPGDRLLLYNSAPVRLVNTQGRELGEKAFFARVLKHAPLGSLDFLKALSNDLLAFAGEGGVSRDISLVTISRNG